MQYIVMAGQYSDKTIIAHIEGEGDIRELFLEFCNKYLPGNVEAVRKAENEDRYTIDGLYDRLRKAEDMLINDGLFGKDEYHYHVGEEGFVNWLRRERGFKDVESDIYSVYFDHPSSLPELSDK